MNYILREFIHILKNFSNIFKIPNMVLVILSYIINKICKTNVLLGYPFLLMIEPTNICNLRCPLCITGTDQMKRPQGNINLEEFKKVISEMKKYLLHVTLWSQGEPFINKDFLKMVRVVSDYHIRTMTSTNGYFIKDKAEEIIESGLSYLIVSVDGISKESYEKYRIGGNFDRVKSGISDLVKIKKQKNVRHPEIELQFLVMKHNEHEIESIRKYASEIGVDFLSLKTVQVYTKEQADAFLPENPKFRRYANNDHLTVNLNVKNICRWLYFCPVINWDGTVSPCCFDKNADIDLGNVFKDGGLKKIWKNKKYNDFRKFLLKGRESIPMCKNCSEGLNVDIVAKERIKA